MKIEKIFLVGKIKNDELEIKNWKIENEGKIKKIKIKSSLHGANWKIEKIEKIDRISKFGMEDMKKKKQNWKLEGNWYCEELKYRNNKPFENWRNWELQNNKNRGKNGKFRRI